MGNLFLLFTILTETGAVICMKLSQGFNNKLYTAAAMVSYGLSFLFLTLTLKYLPAGIANGIWAAASTIPAVLGIFIFNENSALKPFTIAIAIGLVD
jgi:multidrug transporter EmrE-like cation transporter